ncbi:hypothetical protein FRB97_000013 [Tulasnella sp. 331]|nr:hypothetical protein FRB97_000013 [Tulasnella sp. 331]
MALSQHKVISITVDDLEEQQDDVLTPTTSPFKSLLSQYSFRGRPQRTPQENASSSRPEALISAAQRQASNSPLRRPKGETNDVKGAPETSHNPRKRPEHTDLSAVRNTPSPKKKKSLSYAPPETYAHLRVLQDNVKPELDILKWTLYVVVVLFCGINPGIKSAKTGHHFAHPTNQFYRALHQSGLTKELLLPSEDWTMPDRYNYGLTNIVVRPSISSTELTKAEKVASVPTFLGKVSQLRPRIVCFIGREVADAVETAIRQHTRKHGVSSPRKKPVPTPDASIKTESSNAHSSATAEDWITTSAPDLSQDSIVVTAEAGFTSPLATTAPGFRMMSYKIVHDSANAEGNGSIVTETLFFTAPSTSGLVTAYRLEDRVQLFRLLLIEKRAVANGTRTTTGFKPIPPTLYTLE